MRCFNPNPEPRDAAAAAFGNAPIRAETRNGLGTRKKIYIYYVYYRYSPIFPLFKTIQIEGFIHKNNARKAAGYRASPLSLLQFRKAGRAAEARGYFRTAVRFCHPHPQPLFEGSAQTALLCGSPPPP